MEEVTSKKSVFLTDWFVGPNDLLYGRVYGHPEIPDGEEVSTSRVVEFNKETNTAITKNTKYILLRPANDQ